MAYHIDPFDGSLVVDGFENGIADSPFEGISDIRNANIISVPGEVSVGFSTTSATFASSSGTLASADAGTDKITLSGITAALVSGMAVTFSGASLPAGITAGTVYWLGNPDSATIWKLYTDCNLTVLLDITGNGSGTFATVNMGKPFAYTVDTYTAGSTQSYVIDTNGRAWRLEANGSVFMGNTTLTNGNGNGIVAYRGYLFVFRNAVIDYIQLTNGATWNYGWQNLNTAAGTNNPHKAIIGQDDAVYYGDGAFVGSFYRKAGATFDPATASTYTFNQQALALPSNDLAVSVAELGTSLLVGGRLNAIYPWNRVATSFTYPILLAENYISNMVTVNTNTYIFAGQRGRIYITNGSQAQLFKKVPDHLSGTVEPYFLWGGACAIKNQLYFGVQAFTNGGSNLNFYGGVWGIDLDTKGIRMTNKLSYATYAGIASVIVPSIPSSASSFSAGHGLWIGWDSGASTYGVDLTSSTPYTGSQAYVDSDLIPVGTFEKPRDATRVEYRLTKPLVSGESITLQYRLDFSQSYTDIFTDSTAGNFSSSSPINWKNAQWLQIRAVINSTASSPSYVRLKEFRITGMK